MLLFKNIYHATLSLIILQHNVVFLIYQLQYMYRLFVHVFIIQLCLLKEHRRGQDDESQVEEAVDTSQRGSESGPGEVLEQQSTLCSITTFS